MVDINITLSIISVNVNGKNTPIKKQRLSEQILKETQLYVVQKKSTLNMKTQSKGMEKNIHTKPNQKKATISYINLTKWTSEQGKYQR